MGGGGGRKKDLKFFRCILRKGVDTQYLFNVSSLGACSRECFRIINAGRRCGRSWWMQRKTRPPIVRDSMILRAWRPARKSVKDPPARDVGNKSRLPCYIVFVTFPRFFLSEAHTSRILPKRIHTSVGSSWGKISPESLSFYFNSLKGSVYIIFSIILQRFFLVRFKSVTFVFTSLCIRK